MAIKIKRKLLDATIESGIVKAEPKKIRALPVIGDNTPPPSVAHIINEVLEGKNKQVSFFRPSMVSSCVRANVFHYQKAPTSLPNTSPMLHRILDTGTALHTVLQDYLSEHPDVFFSPEVKVYDPDLCVKGSCDGILTERTTGYRWALEIKTIGDSGFKALTKPKPEHVQQATIYMALTGVRWVSFIYLNKNNQDIREFITAFDDEVWDVVQDRLRFFKGFVDRKETPPYNAKECRASIDLCRYVRHCFGLQGIPYTTEEE